MGGSWGRKRRELARLCWEDLRKRAKERKVAGEWKGFIGKKVGNRGDRRNEGGREIERS